MRGTVQTGAQETLDEERVREWKGGTTSFFLVPFSVFFLMEFEKKKERNVFIFLFTDLRPRELASVRAISTPHPRTRVFHRKGVVVGFYSLLHAVPLIDVAVQLPVLVHAIDVLFLMFVLPEPLKRKVVVARFHEEARVVGVVGVVV